MHEVESRRERRPRTRDATDVQPQTSRRLLRAQTSPGPGCVQRCRQIRASTPDRRAASTSRQTLPTRRRI